MCWPRVHGKSLLPFGYIRGDVSQHSSINTATCHNHILSQASTLMYATREVPNSVCRRLDQSDSERSDPR